jgi:hypothetical protein
VTKEGSNQQESDWFEINNKVLKCNNVTREGSNQCEESNFKISSKSWKAAHIGSSDPLNTTKTTANI